jgi:hypothetical protein
MIDDVTNAWLETDMLNTSRAIIREYEPHIVLNEGSMFTFLFGYIFAHLISNKKLSGAKDVRDMIKYVKKKMPYISSKIQDNFKKYEPRLTKR